MAGGSGAGGPRSLDGFWSWGPAEFGWVACGSGIEGPRSLDGWHVARGLDGGGAAEDGWHAALELGARGEGMVGTWQGSWGPAMGSTRLRSWCPFGWHAAQELGARRVWMGGTRWGDGWHVAGELGARAGAHGLGAGARLAGWHAA